MIINEMPGLALGPTTASSNTILNGYTAYDTNGDLITGNIPSKAATTYGASTSDQTISSGQYLSGTQTFAKVNVPSASNILTGSSVTSNGSTLVSGSMTNQGAKTASLNCGATYTIPLGYHNGSGVITANSLASQTSGTATAALIKSGYTAWVNGSQLTGTATVATVRTGSLTFSSSGASANHGGSTTPNYYGINGTIKPIGSSTAVTDSETSTTSVVDIFRAAITAGSMTISADASKIYISSSYNQLQLQINAMGSWYAEQTTNTYPSGTVTWIAIWV